MDRSEGTVCIIPLAAEVGGALRCVDTDSSESLLTESPPDEPEPPSKAI